MQAPQSPVRVPGLVCEATFLDAGEYTSGLGAPGRQPLSHCLSLTVSVWPPSTGLYPGSLPLSLAEAQPEAQT
eukprot:2629038-Rhodomonas_salina.2